MRKYLCRCSALLLCLALSACFFKRLGDDLKPLDTLIEISGTVERAGAYGSEPIIVVPFTLQGEKGKIANFQILTETSPKVPFRFLQLPGQYYVWAFMDANRNLTYDMGEAVSHYGAPKEVAPLPKRGMKGIQLSFRIPPARKPKQSINVMDEEWLDPNKSPVFLKNLGKVVSITDESLALKHGKKAYWEPVRFALEGKGGLMFLQPYSAKKTPVIFVHGANGSPAYFADIIESLDQSRFQPWIFFYPSGLRLELNSGLLLKCVETLQLRHDFEDFHLIAHSMGGLVSQKFLNMGGQKYVKRFITISTPWGGHAAAQSGVDNAPVPIPSWNDMLPDGEFLAQLSKNWAKSDHHLLFGYQGGGSLFSENNDGVVTISSELDWRAQRHAKKIYGFNEMHESILSNADVIRLINRLL